MSNIFKKNKLISLLLVIVLTFGMLFSTAISAYATNINSSGNSGKSKVVTTVTPAKFSATVPYVLPICIDADQNVYTADNVVISNNSNGPIKVSDATLTTNEGWKLVADGTDFKSVPVNSKQFTMRVMNAPVLTSGSIDTDSFGTINGNSDLSVTYDADAAVQGEEVSASNIANVLFTIEWDNVEITSATVDYSALRSAVLSVTTFQKTTERLNIDDVKTISGITKIDDGTTDKSIYAWSDSDGNGYWWTDAITAYLPSNCSNLFYNLQNLTSLDLSGFSSHKVKNMQCMFMDCKNLANLDLSGFDTSSVTNMGFMFYQCGKLNVDLSSLDTSSVTSMEYMFYRCTSFKSIDVSGLDTQSVKSMSHMFDGCSGLTYLDVSNFDVSNVTNMSGMFQSCTKLIKLDLFSNTTKVTDMSKMFYYCNSIKNLDLSRLNTSSVTTMANMFESCYSLEVLDLSSFDTSNVSSMSYMFYRCIKLETIYVSSFVTDKVTNSKYMFMYCESIVGQNGRTYDAYNYDKRYARIDTAKTPGYFTYKAKAA